MDTSSASNSDQSQTPQVETASETPSICETLDRRLTSGRIPNVTVQVNRKGREVALCAVRGVGPHDIVLIVPNVDSLAVGDLVTLAICEGDTPLVAEQSGVVHWATTEGDTRIVAVYTCSRMDLLLEHHQIDDRRGDIRFPVNAQALIKMEGGQRIARIVNYSLNGLFLVSHVALEKERDYHATVTCDDGSVFCLAILPKWTKITPDGNMTGCLLEPQRGVLFARRHNAEVFVPEQD